MSSEYYLFNNDSIPLAPTGRFDSGDIETGGSIQTYQSQRKLDEFLKRVYLYYFHGGFGPLLLGEIANLILFGFIVTTFVTVTSFVQWRDLFAVSSISRDTPLKDFIHISLHNIPVIVWIPTLLMLIFWLLNCLQLVLDLPDLIRIRSFYRNDLAISDVSKIDWHEVLRRLRLTPQVDAIRSDTVEQFSVQLAKIIMRKDNYIISLYQEPIFGLSGFPFTKSVEWSLTYAVWGFLFDGDLVRTDRLAPEALETTSRQLQHRMRFFGLIFLIISPLVLFYLIVYYACSYFDQIRSSPTVLTGRMWSRQALWKFRQYNELPHRFSERIARSRIAATAYLATFPHPLLEKAASASAFLFGAFLIMILGLGLISDDLLVRLTIFDRSLLYYAGIFGLILSVASTNSKRNPDSESQAHLDDVSRDLKYRPVSWDAARSPEALDELKFYFPYRIVIFLQSLVGILLGPFWLGFVLPSSASKLVRSLAAVTTLDPILGPVCVHSTEIEL